MTPVQVRVALPDPPLLLITDRHQAARPLVEIAAAALAAGCRWLLLRDKDLPAAARRDLALALRRITRDSEARLSLGDSLELAAEVGADGVHLARSGAPGRAKAMLGADALVGLSAHDRTEAERAFAGGADYVTLSPIFPTASKPGYGPALGLAVLAPLAAQLAGPVLALGGVTADNAEACRSHGAGGVAVMGEIMRAADPGREIAALLRALGRP